MRIPATKPAVRNLFPVSVIVSGLPLTKAIVVTGPIEAVSRT